MKLISRITTTLLVVTLSCACTSKLRVKGDFPKPLIQTMPYSASIYYHNDFKNYIYREAGEDRDRWIIESGRAQTQQFNNVLNGMFQTVEHLNKPPSDKTQLNSDLTIIPSVYEFQYTMPRETKVKIYEVWLKYNLRVQDSEGNMIADWIMTAYGKTPSAFLQSDEEAMNQAIIIALRDAGINLALGFTQVPEIRRWLQQNPPTDQNSIQPISTDAKLTAGATL